MIARSLAAICLLCLAVAGPAYGESGVASVYGSKGGKTANGERVHPSDLTAAHKTLPFGTRVKVVNQNNGKSVTVRINDRGPFVRGRVIDLTPAGAKALGFSGLTRVTLLTEYVPPRSRM
jgi:rare lipoprotein A